MVGYIFSMSCLFSIPVPWREDRKQAKFLYSVLHFVQIRSTFAHKKVKI